MSDKKNKTAARRLIGFLRPYAGALTAAILCAVGSAAATLAVPLLIGRAIDKIAGAGAVDFSILPPYIVAIIASAAVGGTLQWLSSFISGGAAGRAMRDLRVRLFDAVSEASLSCLDTTPRGRIINAATNDVEQVCDGLTAAMTQLFTGAATVVGTLIFMVSISLPVALTVIILTPLSLAVASVIARGSHKYFRTQTETQGRLNAVAGELLSCREAVAACNYQREALASFDGVNGELQKCGFKAQLYSAMANPSTRFVNAMVYAAAGVMGALSAISGAMTVGGISTFLIYASQYTKPFNEISGVIAQLQSALASAARIFEVIESPREYDVPPENAQKAGENAGEVGFMRVDFSYVPEKPLIKGLSLEIKNGSRVAIVGKTGSGKTTLINLLMRFYLPQSGVITLGGVNTAQMNGKELRSHFGMVLQDTELFEGSVGYNIAYGRPDASDADIECAARLANAHQFIARLPNGYATLIGGKTSLSHGERQLICIARAILTDPEIALLDEATSGIDVRTERIVQRAFAELVRGRTSFVVAHRLETIKNSDVILVMDKGDIAERGTHETLMARNGIYAALYRSMSEA